MGGFSVFVLFFAQFVIRHAWMRHVLTGHKQINSGRHAICIGSRCGWYATFTRKQQETTNHISKRKKKWRWGHQTKILFLVNWYLLSYVSCLEIKSTFTMSAIIQLSFPSAEMLMSCLKLDQSKKFYLNELINLLGFFLNQTINANLENAQ